ncbi:hypothetical protein Tco_0471529 [Tanacetum coccineum]
MAWQCTHPKRTRNATRYKDKAMLAEAQEDGKILDEEQLAFLADLGVPDGQVVQTIIPNNAAFQTEDPDTYNSDCDDISNAKAVLMANISNYGYDIISELPHSETYLNDMENQGVHAMQDFEQTPVVDFIDNEIHSDSNIIPYSQYFDDEETLILEEESRSEMSEKEKDPKAIKQNISHKPIDYKKLNRLSDDFGKRFTPQQQLLAEQAFWLRMSNPTSKPSNASPVKIEALKELPKVRLVNESLKKLKFHLARFDNVVKIRTTLDARTEGEWGFKHTKAVFNNEIILFLKSLKYIFNVFDRDLLNEIMEVQTVFDQMDAAVQQSSGDKQCLEILQDKDSTICKLKDIINSMREKSKEKNVKYDYGEIETKNIELENKIVDIAAQTPSAYTIVPGMFKLDLEPLAPRLLQNREAHIEYLKFTQEQADILQGIVEQAKSKQPLDKELDFACKHAQ